MRTIIVIVCIIALLVSFVAGEKFFVNDFCVEFSHDIKNLGDALLKEDNPKDKAKKLNKKWEKQKNSIFVFANHNNFKEIETEIYNIEYYIDIENHIDAMMFINSAFHNMNELYEGSKITIGNIMWFLKELLKYLFFCDNIYLLLQVRGICKWELWV